MVFCSLVLLLAQADAADKHAALNPVYRTLRQHGVPVGKSVTVKLPPPILADGMSATAQNAAIKKVLGDDFNLEEFERNSAVAPQQLKIRDLPGPDPKTPTRGVDLVFVAHGQLKAIVGKDFLKSGTDLNRERGKVSTPTAVELARRKIVLKPEDADHERFGHIVFGVLDRVELSAAGRSFWSQTEDSILAASQLDPRFNGDPEFPNRWRSMTKKPDGAFEYGPPQPYDGAGNYVKVTRLVEPKGALFIEVHLIFVEPYSWFDGANLLRSKLPLVMQIQVRSFRRELAKASR